jgi:prevent-host-death family protein
LKQNIDKDGARLYNNIKNLERIYKDGYFRDSLCGDLRIEKKFTSSFSSAQRKGDGIVVTQKGKPAAMLLSVKRYLEMKMLLEELEEAIKELADKEYIAELLTAEKELRAGKGTSAQEVFRKLGI